MAQLRDNNARSGRGSLSRTSSTFTTSRGDDGLVTRFASGTQVGLIAVLVFDGTGVEIQASGPSDATDPDAVRDMAAMLKSVRPVSAAPSRSAA